MTTCHPTPDVVCAAAHAPTPLAYMLVFILFMVAFVGLTVFVATRVAID